MKVSNLFADMEPRGPNEAFTTILARPGVRIERIVSQGHATPADAPYEQAEDEWVMLVRGAARRWLLGAGAPAHALRNSATESQCRQGT